MPEKPTSVDSLHRRGFLKISAYLAATLSVAGMTVSKRKQIMETLFGATEACKKSDLVAQRCVRMKTVDHVNVWRVPGAKHALVFLRQFHRAKDMSDEERVMVEEVQAELASILEEFMDDPEVELRDLLDEGESDWLMNFEKEIKSLDDTGDKIDALLNDSRELQEEVQILQKLSELASSDEERNRYNVEIQHLQETIARREERTSDHKQQKGTAAQQKERLSASKMLESKRGLRIQAAEDFGANLHATFAMRDPNYPDRDNIIMRNRERILVQFVSKRGALTFVLYGAAHDFREEIDEWNAKHPDDTITLVEITSKRIEKLEAPEPKTH